MQCSTKPRQCASSQVANTNVAQPAPITLTQSEPKLNGLVMSTHGLLCWYIASYLNKNASIHLSQSHSDFPSSLFDRIGSSIKSRLLALAAAICWDQLRSIYPVSRNFLYSLFFKFICFEGGRNRRHNRKSPFYLSYATERQSFRLGLDMSQAEAT